MNPELDRDFVVSWHHSGEDWPMAVSVVAKDPLQAVVEAFKPAGIELSHEDSLIDTQEADAKQHQWVIAIDHPSWNEPVFVTETRSMPIVAAYVVAKHMPRTHWDAFFAELGEREQILTEAIDSVPDFLWRQLTDNERNADEQIRLADRD